MEKKGIVWFRQDLRLHDNEALTEALQYCKEIIPVYVFDERFFSNKTPLLDLPKTGCHRTKFIIQCVEDLRASLRKLGSDLIVRVGKAEEEIFKIAFQQKTSWVFCNRERTQEEVDIQDALEKKLWSIGQEVRFSRGKLLYYTSDLPFPITHTPDVFSHFKKEVERFVAVRKPLSAPEIIPPFSASIPTGEIPKLSSFGFSELKEDQRAVLLFKGGETEGLERMHYYFQKSDLAKNYKETHNCLIGSDFSTKFSPWLAMGCLSPKLVYQELKNYEAVHGRNDSTHAIFIGLLRRDFFRLMAKKHENSIFKIGGLRKSKNKDLKNDWHLFKLWKEGRTGVPLIDANMRELGLTGYMSSRGRQIVGSFLVNNLKVNWQLGAEYFESILIDYDTASNWGNWNFIGGVGNDPKEDPHFNILNQAKRHDPKGDYVKLWLPELSVVPQNRIHRPDTLTEEEQEELHFTIGADYPKAMISTSHWE